jgi:hypothetical protein
VEAELGNGDHLGGRQGRRMGHSSFLPSICWITLGGIGRKQEDVDREGATEYLN